MIYWDDEAVILNLLVLTMLGILGTQAQRFGAGCLAYQEGGLGITTLAEESNLFRYCGPNTPINCQDSRFVPAASHAQLFQL